MAGDDPEVVTYSLMNGNPDSSGYYLEAARFADEAEVAGAPLLEVVISFISSIAERGSEPVRSRRITFSSS